MRRCKQAGSFAHHMKIGQRRFQFFAHLGKVPVTGFPGPPDEHIIPTCTTMRWDGQARNFPQTAFCTVASNSVSNLFCAGVTNAWCIVISAFPALKHKPRSCLPWPTRSTQEIRTFFQYFKTQKRRLGRPGRLIRCHFQKLRAKRFPATHATCVQDLATSFGCHARTEPVTPLANEVRGLICALHRVSPFLRPSLKRDSDDRSNLVKPGL